MSTAASDAWPDVRYSSWSATCDTLHAHTQVLGKLAVRDQALGDLGLTTLVSLIQPGNVASARVAEKLGMRPDGHGRGAHGESVVVHRLTA